MARQIAVLMSILNNDNQRKIVEGMIDAAKETDCNLFIFASYVSHRDREECVRGANQILYLPDFDAFDGAIFAKNTIQYPPAAEYAEHELLKKHLPTVSIDVEIPGMSSVCFSSYEAEYRMVEHFITEHGCRDIHYISGPLFHMEAQKRYQAYCDVLKKYGIPYREDYVFEGYFMEDSGRAAVKKFLKDGTCPKVIICANDDMAVGAMETLKQHGYRIPEDVAVAGFDNAELSELQSPALTTVEKDQHEVGYRAVYEVLSLLEGGAPQNHVVHGHLEIRKSCGCRMEDQLTPEKLREKFVHWHSMTQSIGDGMRNMISDFYGLETPEELFEVLKKYIAQLEVGSFYLCLCDRERLFGRREDAFMGVFDIPQANLDYTEEISLPIAYEEGEFHSYEKFPKGLVLPKECREKSGGNYYVVLPVYYQSCCYGYCISGNCHLPLEDGLYYSWLMNIGIGLENVRKWMMLSDVVLRLNGMWAYDTLTHLYNRAGFFYYAESMLEEMKIREEKVFLLFMDIDGLKQVNDNFGHEAGDVLIRGMAEVLKASVKEGQIIMRYGGDEFVILGSCADRADAQQLAQTIRDGMEQRNRRGDIPFPLSASIGVSCYHASEITNLDRLIEQADKKMYDEKRRKRTAKRKQN